MAKGLGFKVLGFSAWLRGRLEVSSLGLKGPSSGKKISDNTFSILCHDMIGGIVLTREM